MTLKIAVISLLPEIFASLDHGVTGRAIKQGLVNISYWNPRDWASGPYKQVDDKPYGGGPGMVMMYEPLREAILHAKKQLPENAKVIYLSPQGKHICQNEINKCVSSKTPLIFLAGRYEGIDERIIENYVDEEWSIGDFVLSGGELAVMVFIDAITRLIPGSLGNLSSAHQDSFMNDLLDHQHYTRPDNIDGKKVPSILLSGDHQKIARWRRKQALGRTQLRRPEILDKLDLDKNDKQLLEEFNNEHNN